MAVSANPKFSIIIPSYLSFYSGCASYREQKFIRAIDSCVNQHYRNFEVIIVADGCHKTMKLYETYYRSFDFIKCFYQEKKERWSGHLRNYGISKATGTHLTYLDTDDKLGPNHLQILADNVSDYDWVWYDDYTMTIRYKPRVNICELKYGYCGTSNVTHKITAPVKWTATGYSKDDWQFIQDLMKLPNGKKILVPEYYICHQPGRMDV